MLVHCFGGCATPDVLAAVGLSLADLYPERLADHVAPGDRRHLHAARAALKAASDDALLVALAAENVAQGVTLNDEDRALVAEAAARIREARAVAL